MELKNSKVLSVFESGNEQLSKKMIGVLEKMVSSLMIFFDRTKEFRGLKVGKLLIGDEIFSPLFKQHLE